MTVYAASNRMAVCVSTAHGGCNVTHSRPVRNGVPAKLWSLDCACETHLRTDPGWSTTISEIPETYDEKLAREDFEKRGALDRDQVMALAMAKLAGVELPETLRRPVSGLQPHIPIVAGQVVCDAGHPNEAGSKFCAECGSALREPLKPVCPNGHEVAARAKFCGECGSPMTPALEAAPPAPAESPAGGRAKPLKDWRAEDLKALARDKGLDDSGTRRELLDRLKTAA